MAAERSTAISDLWLQLKPIPPIVLPPEAYQLRQVPYEIQIYSPSRPPMPTVVGVPSPYRPIRPSDYRPGPLTPPPKRKRKPRRPKPAQEQPPRTPVNRRPVVVQTPLSRRKPRTPHHTLRSSRMSPPRFGDEDLVTRGSPQQNIVVIYITW